MPLYVFALQGFVCPLQLLFTFTSITNLDNCFTLIRVSSPDEWFFTGKSKSRANPKYSGKTTFAFAKSAWFCFTFFSFLGSEGEATAQWHPPRYASDCGKPQICLFAKYQRPFSHLLLETQLVLTQYQD